MEMAKLWQITVGEETKDVRLGMTDQDEDLLITRVVESSSRNCLEVYMKARPSKEEEWTEEFLGGKYVNCPYVVVQMPKHFLEEGEVF